MAGLVRWTMLVLTSVLICLLMVLSVTWRISGLSSSLELNGKWGLLLLQKAPAAEVAREIWGANPPDWAKTLAVVWERADVPSWWWLPILFIGLRLLTGSYARRRSRR